MNNEQSEVSWHPHHPNGCGWVIVAAVFLFVLVVTGAGIYHEVNFYPDPVSPELDTLRNGIDSVIYDSTLEDHSRIPDTSDGFQSINDSSANIWHFYSDSGCCVLKSNKLWSDTFSRASPQIQRAYDSTIKARIGTFRLIPNQSPHLTMQMFNGILDNTVRLICGNDTVYVFFGQKCIAKGLSDGKIIFKDSTEYRRAQDSAKQWHNRMIRRDSL